MTALAARAGVGGETVGRLELALEEWVVNLRRHSSAGPGGKVEVAVRREPLRLVVEVADDGEPFDPTAVPDPDVSGPIEEREAGGLGILFIRRMADEFDYRREAGRNVVTLAFAAPRS